MVAAAPLTHFEELGVLHLLAEIPTDDLARYPDVVRVAALEGSGAPVSDLDLLEREHTARSHQVRLDAGQRLA